MIGFVAIVLLLASAPPEGLRDSAAWPDQPAIMNDQDEMTGLERFATHLFDRFRETTDWDAHWTYLGAAIEDIYVQNAWDSEEDAFSLELIETVGAIPPWQFRDRVDAFMNAIGDRYLLDEEQEALFQDTILREAGGLFARHATRLLPDVMESFQTRLAGEPFTPQQVARWTENSAPIFDDARRSFNATSLELLRQLDPDQQSMMLADLSAANRRMDRVAELRELWLRGEWEPGDWGLSEDPIQRGEVPGGFQPPPPPPGAGLPGESVGESGPAGSQPSSRPTADTDPWAAYVRDFIRRYKLDDAQHRRAWVVYRAAVERRAFHQRRHDQKMEHLNGLPRAGDERFAARVAELASSHAARIELIFESMKHRLDKLPMRRQRHAAEPTTTVPEIADEQRSDGTAAPAP